MTDRLGLYNGALLNLGEQRLLSLTDDIEARYALDEAWENEASIKTVLEEGQWNFAIRTQKLTFDPGIEPDFGFRRAFEKPDDWVRTVGMSANEYFTPPLIDMVDEQGYWFADVEELYVRFVSDDAQFGSDLSIWPEKFKRAFEWYLAYRAVFRIKQNRQAQDDAEKRYESALVLARSRDAMNESAVFPAEGSWSRSRRLGRGGNRDRGNIHQLIG